VWFVITLRRTLLSLTADLTFENCPRAFREAMLFIPDVRTGSGYQSFFAAELPENQRNYPN